jgi:hypothetical protein
VKANTNMLFTSSELLEAHEQEIEAKEIDIAIKAANKVEKRKRAADREDAKQLKRAAREAKWAEVAAKKVRPPKRGMYTCAYCYRELPASLGTWLGCDNCEDYWVCGGCWDADALVAEHEGVCKARNNL